VGEEVHARGEVLSPPPADLPPEDSPTAFVRRTAVMSVGTSLSRLTGFLRLAALTYALGVAQTRLADAYNVANNTPNIVYELVLGGILTSVFVPVFVEWLETRGRDEATEVARSVITIALVVLSAIALVTMLAAPWIVRLYTLLAPAKQAASERQLATFLLRWFMPQIVFYGVGAAAIGLLNAHRKFAVPMFAPILNNLIVVATFVTFAALPGPRTPGPTTITTAQRYVLGIGTTLGVIGMTLVLLPALRVVGFRFRFRLHWNHEAVRRIARLAMWTFVYVAVNQVGLFVIIVLAGRDTGAYAAYTAAFILFQLPHAIFAVSIFTALLPAMSSRWAEGDADGFRTLLSQGIRATGTVVVPAALGYIVLATPIVRLLLQHGETRPSDAELIADVLVFFSMGLLSFSGFQLLLRAFYSMQDTRTPALINIAAVAVNTGANLLYFFTFHMGVKGLALGYATAYTFASIVAGAVIRKRLGGLDGRRIASALSRTLIAGAATAGAAWVTAWVLGRALGTITLGARALQVFAAIGAGLLVFAGSALILRVEEVDVFRRMLRSRLSR